MMSPIGLIAGKGDFPALLAKAAHDRGQPIVLFGIEGYTDRQVEKFTSEAHYVGLGELGRLLELLKKTKVRKVLLAGAVPKKQIYDPALPLDPIARHFIGATRNKGDDHLLRAFRLFLKARCGVSVMDARGILKEALAPKGVLTRRGPSESEWRDLRLGLRAARHIGKMDIGQTVVIKDGIVLAVEAVEGTDHAIRRAGGLGRGDVVVVKTSKPNQDLRFDLPCVGLETLNTLTAVSSRVLGVEAGKTILISKKAFLEKADENGMTIVGL